MDPPMETRILFIGLDGVGKSTIITKLRDFKNEEITEIYPTPFIKIHTVKYDAKDLKMVEVSGMKRYRKCWKMFYNEVSGIFFVVDSTDVGRLQIVKELIQQLDKDLQKIMPIAFLINKQDIDNSMSMDQIKNYLEIDKINTKFIWKIFRCVAYTGMGLSDALNFIRSQEMN